MHALRSDFYAVEYDLRVNWVHIWFFVWTHKAPPITEFALDRVYHRSAVTVHPGHGCGFQLKQSAISLCFNSGRAPFVVCCMRRSSLAVCGGMCVCARAMRRSKPLRVYTSNLLAKLIIVNPYWYLRAFKFLAIVASRLLAAAAARLYESMRACTSPTLAPIHRNDERTHTFSRVLCAYAGLAHAHQFTQLVQTVCTHRLLCYTVQAHALTHARAHTCTRTHTHSSAGAS